MNSKTKILIGVLVFFVIVSMGLLFRGIKQDVIQPSEELFSTSIELSRCGEYSPRYVNLPVTLPIDTEAQAQIIAKACLEKAIFKNQPEKITDDKNFWYIESPKRQGLDYPFWNMTINKITGRTEYIAVK